MKCTNVQKSDSKSTAVHTSNFMKTQDISKNKQALRSMASLHVAGVPWPWTHGPLRGASLASASQVRRTSQVPRCPACPKPHTSCSESMSRRPSGRPCRGATCPIGDVGEPRGRWPAADIPTAEPRPGPWESAPPQASLATLPKPPGQRATLELDTGTHCPHHPCPQPSKQASNRELLSPTPWPPAQGPGRTPGAAAHPVPGCRDVLLGISLGFQAPPHRRAHGGVGTILADDFGRGTHRRSWYLKSDMCPSAPAWGVPVPPAASCPSLHVLCRDGQVCVSCVKVGRCPRGAPSVNVTALHG